jgi:hypothetical protein
MAKSTKPTVTRRVEEVLQLRLRGAGFTEIRHYASQNDPPSNRPWGVGDRQLRRYISQSDELIADTTERNRTRMFDLHLARRRYLYGVAVQAGDVRGAMAVLQDEAKLLGLYPPEQFGITGNMPPLEVFLAALPPQMADALREGIREGLAERKAEERLAAAARANPAAGPSDQAPPDSANGNARFDPMPHNDRPGP